MLRELHISNLAIIEKADIELAGGLNVFTGQTGAGKSLILGALELLLGLRGGGEDAATFVRPDCPEARVSGLFEISSPLTAQRLSDVLDRPLPPGEPVLITRRVLASGRSSVSVNGEAVTAGMLKEAGEFLVDIHGQHDQQFLLKPANQLLILDAFADALDLRRTFADTLGQWREQLRRLSELKQSQEKRAEQLELYRFQIDEIDAAKVAPGEYEQAKNRYGVLKNAARLKGQSAQILAGLCEGDDTVLDRVSGVRHSLAELVRLDPSLADLAAQLEQAGGFLQDVAMALSRYQDRLDVDPAELEQVEQRLDVLNRLIHKYAKAAAPGDDPLAAVLAHRRQIGEKAAALEADAQVLDGLDRQIAELQKELLAAGARLGRKRRDAAKKLKALVEAQFRDLEMHEATFDVDLRPLKLDDPQLDSSGLDAMDFLVRTNPGQECLPLRKIASGGEISRIMLALKTILADKDQITVLVFDEIDANIGDRLGATIGRKMRELAHGGRPRTGDRKPKADNRKSEIEDRKSKAEGAGRTGRNGNGDPTAAPTHQIICITHLSQIAACADHHLQISKDVIDGPAGRQTLTKVRILDGEDRVRELAEMLAGKNATPAVLTHARDLLARAQKK